MTVVTGATEHVHKWPRWKRTLAIVLGVLLIILALVSFVLFSANIWVLAESVALGITAIFLIGIGYTR